MEIRGPWFVGEIETALRVSGGPNKFVAYIFLTGNEPDARLEVSGQHVDDMVGVGFMRVYSNNEGVLDLTPNKKLSIAFAREELGGTD